MGEGIYHLLLWRGVRKAVLGYHNGKALIVGGFCELTYYIVTGRELDVYKLEILIKAYQLRDPAGIFVCGERGFAPLGAGG